MYDDHHPAIETENPRRPSRRIAGSEILRIVRGLSDHAEFLVVIFICFGGFIVSSIWWYVAFGQAANHSLFDTVGNITLIIHEMIALFAVGVFLSVRGWPLETLKFDVSWANSFRGVGLVLLYYVLYYAAYKIFPINDGYSSQSTSLHTVTLGLVLSGILVSIINPIFEEIIVVGYVMTVVGARYGAVAAIGVSTLIRVLYHLYQGDAAFISILPLGILFGLAYWQRRSLWPLILAHGLLDLAAYSQGWAQVQG